MKYLLFISLFSFPFAILQSQVWFQGGTGSGVALNDTLYCSVESENIFSNSTSLGSGADFSFVALCSAEGEGVAYQSTDSVSGFSFSEAYFCDIDGQNSIFTSSVENSGFSFSSVDLCNTAADRTPFRGLDGSGFKSIYETCIIPTVPLPIELLSFDAVQNEENVSLFWSTASEINNSYFIVERSKDGVYWNDILEVEGAGNSSTIITYQDIDYEPLLGVSYYRLRQVDFDGNFSYSKIEAVNFEEQYDNTIIAYPNPAKDMITFTGNIDQYAVFNIIGQNVQLKINSLGKENSLLILDISNLSSGVYVLKTKDNKTCKFNVR